MRTQARHAHVRIKNMRAHTYKRTHAWKQSTHVQANSRMHACTYARTQACVHARAHAPTHCWFWMIKNWTHAKLCRVWFGKFGSEQFRHLKNYAEHAMSSSWSKNWAHAIPCRACSAQFVSAKFEGAQNYAEHALPSLRAKNLSTRKNYAKHTLPIFTAKKLSKRNRMKRTLR